MSLQLQITNPSKEEMNSTLNTLKEEQEDVSDSLEDLLIFPSRQGLRRLMGIIQHYFAMEMEALSSGGDSLTLDEQHQSIVSDQKELLDLCMKELDGHTGASIMPPCSSN